MLRQSAEAHGQQRTGGQHAGHGGQARRDPFPRQLERRAQRPRGQIRSQHEDDAVKRQRPVSELGCRVVQEGTTNVLRHAGGAKTTVPVERTGDVVTVRVRNAASPSADSRPGPGGGRGLAGLRRARGERRSPAVITAYESGFLDSGD